MHGCVLVPLLVRPAAIRTPWFFRTSRRGAHKRVALSPNRVCVTTRGCAKKALWRATSARRAHTTRSAFESVHASMCKHLSLGTHALYSVVGCSDKSCTVVLVLLAFSREDVPAYHWSRFYRCYSALPSTRELQEPVLHRALGRCSWWVYFLHLSTDGVIFHPDRKKSII